MARIVSYLRGWWKRYIVDDFESLWPNDDYEKHIPHDDNLF
jgi:hypothetical protein